MFYEYLCVCSFDFVVDNDKNSSWPSSYVHFFQNFARQVTHTFIIVSGKNRVCLTLINEIRYYVVIYCRIQCYVRMETIAGVIELILYCDLVCGALK